MTANQLNSSCLMEFEKKLICCSTGMMQCIHVSEAIYTNLLINFPAKNSHVPFPHPWCGIVDQVNSHLTLPRESGAETISGRRFGINLYPEFEMAPIIYIRYYSRHHLEKIIYRRFLSFRVLFIGQWLHIHELESITVTHKYMFDIYPTYTDTP